MCFNYFIIILIWCEVNLLIECLTPNYCFIFQLILFINYNKSKKYILTNKLTN